MTAAADTLEVASDIDAEEAAGGTKCWKCGTVKLGPKTTVQDTMVRGNARFRVKIVGRRNLKECCGRDSWKPNQKCPEIEKQNVMNQE